jgi:alkanesulfonate monooxygenase SsuD/methylene tetrahydromethanopterin reductase-like flavin-dependent oxidoreductase (luciferase family)
MQFGFMLLPRDLEETRAAARLGEELGFSWMGIADSPTVYEESYLHQLEAARATTTLRVGPMASHVVARHPVIIGNLLATLNEFTSGRVVGTLATGNSAARGLGLKPASVDQLGQAIEAIRGYWRGEGGKLWNSVIPPTGLPREAPEIIVAADGPRVADLAGRVGDGVLYGGTMDPEVRRRRLEAGRRDERQQAWIAPTVSLAETHEDVNADLGAMVVAMANRAMRGDLSERAVPPEIQEDVHKMRQAYDYAFHADSSRPRNVEVVSPRLADYLIDTLCVWGDEERWSHTLSELERDGWTGVMFILGQAKQLEVVRAVGERLARTGMLDAPAPSAR